MKGSLQFLHHAVRERETSIDFHTHPMFEIVYYKSGYGNTTLHRSPYSYEPYSFVVIHPNCPHDEMRKSDTEVLYFGFTYDQDPLVLQTGMYQDNEGRDVLNLIEQMAGEINARKKHFGLKVDLLLQQIMIEIQRLSGASSVQDARIAKETERQIQFAKQYIDQYYTQKISLTQLADISGYSYDHFRHTFKSWTGLTPMNYILQLRIEKAREMILSGEANLTQTALDCGFSSLAQFSNAFKKAAGTSPSGFKHLHTDLAAGSKSR
jgi:AraC-like DNA-binding protein